MSVAMNSIKMYANGFKKIKLNDTKGVLSNANNHKWVRYAQNGDKITILPSGTQVIEGFCFKKVIKPDNSEYFKKMYSNNAYTIHRKRPNESSELLKIYPNVADKTCRNNKGEHYFDFLERIGKEERNAQASFNKKYANNLNMLRVPDKREPFERFVTNDKPEKLVSAKQIKQEPLKSWVIK